MRREVESPANQGWQRIGARKEIYEKRESSADDFTKNTQKVPKKSAAFHSHQPQSLTDKGFQRDAMRESNHAKNSEKPAKPLYCLLPAPYLGVLFIAFQSRKLLHCSQTPAGKGLQSDE